MPRSFVIALSLAACVFGGVTLGGRIVPALASPPQRLSPEAPTLSTSPIHAGCVRVTSSSCKIHVDPFTLQTPFGETLQAFQIRLNDQVVYDYHTDVSNPPFGSYTPSVVKKDIAAKCGQTYSVQLFARDSSTAFLVQTGQADQVVCPVGTYWQYMPVIKRK